MGRGPLRSIWRVFAIQRLVLERRAFALPAAGDPNAV